jgi:hypothetical protein
MNARPTPGHGILSDFGVTLLRGGLIFIFASDPPEAHPRIEEFGMVAVLQGLGLFSSQQVIDLTHLFGGQRPMVQGRTIFFDLRDGSETWNRQRPLASSPEPGQCSLG